MFDQPGESALRGGAGLSSTMVAFGFHWSRGRQEPIFEVAEGKVPYSSDVVGVDEVVEMVSSVACGFGLEVDTV